MTITRHLPTAPRSVVIAEPPTCLTLASAAPSRIELQQCCGRRCGKATFPQMQNLLHPCIPPEEASGQLLRPRNCLRGGCLAGNYNDHFCFQPQCQTKTLHESRLGAANRADIECGKSYGLGKYFQPQAGLPGAKMRPPKSKSKSEMFKQNIKMMPDSSRTNRL